MKLNKKILITLLVLITTLIGSLSLVQLRQKISTVGREIKILELEIRDLKIELAAKEKMLAELYRPTYLETVLGRYMRSPKPQEIILVKEESMIDSKDTFALIKMRKILGESQP